jgi:hypothetical protein
MNVATPHAFDAQDFKAFRKATIEPWLAQKEVERRAIERRVAIRICIVLVPIMLAIVGFMLFYRADAPVSAPGRIFVLVIPVFGVLTVIGGAYLYWAFSELESWGDRLRRDLYRLIFDRLGYRYTADSSLALMDEVHQCGILKDYDERHVEDRVQGAVGKTQFDLSDCKLVRKYKRRNAGEGRETVFHGLIGSFTFPKPFHGQTVVLVDKGTISNRLSGLLRDDKRVVLENAEFEDLFEVFSTDQVEARYLLNPVFMERLIALRRHFRAPLQAAFRDGKLYIAVDLGEDHFRNPPVHFDVSDPGEIHLVMFRVRLISEAVEMLNLNSPALV